MMGELAGKRVLVTGATGFIGSHLARRLVAEGAHVSVFMRATSDRRSLAQVLDQVTVHEVDICDADGVRAAMAATRPQIVFHLAAIGMSEPFISPEIAHDPFGKMNLLVKVTIAMLDSRSSTI